MENLKNIVNPIKLIAAAPDLIKEVQQQLKLVGLLDTVDGIAGPKTIIAFNKFKTLEYLEQPNILGQSTAIALLEATTSRFSPTENPLSPIDRTIKFPWGKTVQTSDPISEHFTWGEATKEGTRIPQSKEIVTRILKCASVLEEIRAVLGSPPIIITSWYRDPHSNKAVGGATQSRHLLGDGVDIQVFGYSGFEVFDRLNTWYGARGGLGKARTFCHIDCRQFKARWNYSNK